MYVMNEDYLNTNSCLSSLCQFPVRNAQPLQIEMIVSDAESRPFDNFTSLQWRWTSSDQKLLPTPQVSALSHLEGKGKLPMFIVIRSENWC